MFAITTPKKGFTTPLTETSPSTHSCTESCSPGDWSPSGKCGRNGCYHATKIKDLATQRITLYIMLNSEMHAHSGFQRISPLQICSLFVEMCAAEDNFLSNPTAENKAQLDELRLELLYLGHIETLQQKSLVSAYGQSQNPTIK